METPRPTPQPATPAPSDLAPTEHVLERVLLNRALADWRSLRRYHRTGAATYRDVRDARHAYLKARRKLEQVCHVPEEDVITVPAP